MSEQSLRITETFFSIQGESSFVGFPTVFVRLTGCPLRCHYCDSEYAFYGGEKRLINDLVTEVKSHGDNGLIVSLETSGAMDVAEVDQRVHLVMDLKTPASGEVAKNRYENIQHLSEKDQIKFVLCDRQDYEWAAFQIGHYQLNHKVGDIFLSPSYEQLKAESIAQWILDDKLPVRLQTQLHKALWGDKPGV